MLNWKQSNSVTLQCTIDLAELYRDPQKIRAFKSRWKAFRNSDPSLPHIARLRGNTLIYASEQLIPARTDRRPPLLLVLGNPAAHSVRSGMFFAFEAGHREHRFWKSILKPAGILDLPFENQRSVEALNRSRRQRITELTYEGPFRIGLCVALTLPSAPGGPWGGVSGVHRLFGAGALRRIEQTERRRVVECAETFVGEAGAVVAFQKNAWENLRADENPPYALATVKNGCLRGRLRDNPKVALYCVAPTRLVGPCRKGLVQFREAFFQGTSIGL